MFDALKGLKEALAAKERITEERRILAEDAIEELNHTFSKLEKGTMITVVYYCTYEQCYKQLTGPVEKIDSYWHNLLIGKICIDFDDIYDVLL